MTCASSKFGDKHRGRDGIEICFTISGHFGAVIVAMRMQNKGLLHWCS